MPSSARGACRTLLALLFATALAPRGSAQQPPNILLVLSDDHSAAFVGAYDNPSIRTPNLDQFAREGVRFDRAYVASPQCVPSRASIMTGRSPVRIQMTRFSAALPREIATFPELLRAQAGYYTGAVGRSYHLDGGRRPLESQEVFERYDLVTFPDRLDHIQPSGGGADQEVPGLVADFLDQVPEGKPFFLWANFSDPHRRLDRDAISSPHDPEEVRLPPFFPDTRLVREDLARYHDEVARLDENFGRILSLLDERGLSGNTIVVFMGDNGGALLRGKGTLYELGVRVPLLVRWPNVVEPGEISEGLISGEDLAPTFLEAAGVGVPDEISGVSFLDLLQGRPFEGHSHVFAERGSHGTGLPGNSAAFDLGRTIIGNRYKLIYNALWRLPYTPVDFGGDAFWKEIQEQNRQGVLGATFTELYFPPARSMFELYDIREDPFEMNNLAEDSEHAVVLRELKAELQEWMILNRDYLPLPIPPSRGR